MLRRSKTAGDVSGVVLREGHHKIPIQRCRHARIFVVSEDVEIFHHGEVFIHYGDGSVHAQILIGAGREKLSVDLVLQE